MKAAGLYGAFRLRLGSLTLRGWMVHPGRPKALLYFSGNDERVEDFRADAAHRLPERGYGASEDEPNKPALVADAVALYDEVTPHRTRVAVTGRGPGRFLR